MITGQTKQELEDLAFHALCMGFHEAFTRDLPINELSGYAEERMKEALLKALEPANTTKD